MFFNKNIEILMILLKNHLIQFQKSKKLIKMSLGVLHQKIIQLILIIHKHLI